MKVKSYKAGSVGEVELVAPFGEKVSTAPKDAVVMHMANQRQGTASTKGRSEVKGTNKKPYKQKHTGRARPVTSSRPSGGGTASRPSPVTSYHMPTKARRVALRSAIAGKIATVSLSSRTSGMGRATLRPLARSSVTWTRPTRPAWSSPIATRTSASRSATSPGRGPHRRRAVRHDVVNGGTTSGQRRARPPERTVDKSADASNNGGES